MARTSSYPVARINRGLTVETLAKVARHPRGRDAMLLLPLLIWKRQMTGETWLKVTNKEWHRRVGDRPRKGRAAKVLEELGLVEVRRQGHQTLAIKLATPVDPKTGDANPRESRTSGRSRFDDHGIPDRAPTQAEWAAIRRR